MRSLTLLTIFFFFITALNATTHTTVSNGDWDDASTWNTGQVPNIGSWPGDEVIINHKIEVDRNLSFKQGASMTVNSNASLEIDGYLKLEGTGTFLIAVNGAVECEEVRHTAWDGSLSVNGNLVVEGKISISGVAEFNTGGNIYCEKIEVKGSGAFTSKGGMIQIEDEWKITGGTEVKISNTEIVVEEKFNRTGGPNISFIGGTLSVGEHFVGKGGGTICFDGTVVTVGDKTELKGSVIVSIGGRGSFTSDKIKMSGAACLIGKGLGGWLNCETFECTGSAYVYCVDESCWYDADNDDEMPKQLDLGSGSNTVLPVELVYFDAEVAADGMLVVSWATAVEINNDFFTIEMSLDGRDWTAMDEVIGAGNSDVELSYKWTEENMAVEGTAYFRLKQTDFDGTFTYSEIESVEFATAESEAFEVNVYPNPATEYVMIQGLAADAAPQIMLINMQGQNIKVVSTDQGQNTRVDIPTNLPAGTYGLVIQNGGMVQTQQLVIQK
ncbi:MAG: T9SS type A sorting domain-containing protein [Saprospiraceae bacterium]|nr:T9SS type A sorting domain-containing protein [Saprospiraceae bacterium]